MKRITKCRACGSPALSPALNISGMASGQNGFFGGGAPREEEEYVFCDSSQDENACGLLQRKYESEGANPSQRMPSGTYRATRNHLRTVATEALELVSGRECSVLDIGCSDGSLLSYYPRWVERVGVDHHPVQPLGQDQRRAGLAGGGGACNKGRAFAAFVRAAHGTVRTRMAFVVSVIADPDKTVSTPLLLPVPLARYHRQRSQPASTRKGRKKEFSPQNSARPRSPQRFDYSTQREQSSRALCRATRTFVIKIPGTGGGDGAFASGGGDSDAGELMGRIRRATREQQTRDTSASSSKEVTIEFLCFCFFWGGGASSFFTSFTF